MNRQRDHSPDRMDWNELAVEEEEENEERIHERLFPSVQEIEAIEIPSCQRVFEQLDNERKRQQQQQQQQQQQKALVRQTKYESSPPFAPEKEFRIPSTHNPVDDSYYYYDDQHDDDDDDRKPAATSSNSSCLRPGAVDVAPPPPPSSRQTNNNRRWITVSPDLELPLLGADETVQALRQGHMACTLCGVCGHYIYCCASAQYVLCPTCLVVSPVEPVDQRSSSSSSSDWKKPTKDPIAGVGLGMAEGDFLAFYQEQDF